MRTDQRAARGHRVGHRVVWLTGGASGCAPAVFAGALISLALLFTGHRPLIQRASGRRRQGALTARV
jgi:hypothetical protein